MRKKYFVLAMGIAAVMMAGGCSGGASDAKTEASQTEAGAGQQESSSMSDSEKASYYASENSLDDQVSDAPVKVVGTIMEVGEDSITVDSGSDTGYIGEMVLMIDPDNTLVLDTDGFPVGLGEVQTGAFEAYLGPAMTMSLPPQTTPYAVIVNIPEGQEAPQYVVAAGKVDEIQGRQTLMGVDESEYTLARNVDVQPYLTKNIVKLEDIDADSRCLVWTNDEGDVNRIVLFGE